MPGAGAGPLVIAPFGAGAVELPWLGGVSGVTGDLPGVEPAGAGGTGTLLCNHQQHFASSFFIGCDISTASILKAREAASLHVLLVMVSSVLYKHGLV